MIQRRPSDASNDEETSVSTDVLRHRKLVRRSHFMTIIVAWVITVPASAILAAGAYYLISMI
jgi:PiT family inorganic phosphate transporter